MGLFGKSKDEKIKEELEEKLEKVKEDFENGKSLEDINGDVEYNYNVNKDGEISKVRISVDKTKYNFHMGFDIKLGRNNIISTIKHLVQAREILNDETGDRLFKEAKKLKNF